MGQSDQIAWAEEVGEGGRVGVLSIVLKCLSWARPAVKKSLRCVGLAVMKAQYWVESMEGGASGSVAGISLISSSALGSGSFPAVCEFSGSAVAIKADIS